MRLLPTATAVVTFAVVLSAGAAKMPVEAPPSAPVARASAPAAYVADPAAAKLTPKATMLDPDSQELATLVKRGQQLAASGDMSAARLMLRRAADERNAHAALALGATYDPNVLATLGIRGVAPDIAAARSWYKKAKEYGSAEASRRLEI